ncbi:MAG: SprT-like domain-containing protein [bacterium]
MSLNDFHSLPALFRKLNRLYFEGKVASTLAWGIARSKRVKRSRRLGSYNPRTDTITLHPVLNQAEIPSYVVAAILHHEMCHAYVPSKKIRGRLYHHTPEFRKKEKEFDYYRQANEWIKKNLKFLFKPPAPRQSTVSRLAALQLTLF